MKTSLSLIMQLIIKFSSNCTVSKYFKSKTPLKIMKTDSVILKKKSEYAVKIIQIQVYPEIITYL